MSETQFPRAAGKAPEPTEEQKAAREIEVHWAEVYGYEPPDGYPDLARIRAERYGHAPVARYRNSDGFRTHLSAVPALPDPAVELAKQERARRRSQQAIAIRYGRAETPRYSDPDDE